MNAQNEVAPPHSHDKVTIWADNDTLRYYQSVADRLQMPLSALLAICLRNFAEIKYEPPLEL